MVKIERGYLITGDRFFDATVYFLRGAIGSLHQQIHEQQDVVDVAVVRVEICKKTHFSCQYASLCVSFFRFNTFDKYNTKT